MALAAVAHRAPGPGALAGHESGLVQLVLAVELSLEALDARHDVCKAKVGKGGIVEHGDDGVVHWRKTIGDDQDLVELGDGGGGVRQLKGSAANTRHEELGGLAFRFA